MKKLLLANLMMICCANVSFAEIVYLQSSNGKYVSANYSEGGMLIADRPDPHDWEKFNLTKDGDRYTIQASNGKYVSANYSEGGMLIADRPDPHDWEKFKIIPVK